MLFHQDNAPVHTSSQVLAAIRNAGFELLHRQSYLPDDDWLLFIPKLEEFMKQCKFTDEKDVICAENGWLEEQDQQFFYNGIWAWEKQGASYISVARDYIEKWQNMIHISCD